MLPLRFSTNGEEAVIRRVGGSDEVRRHLGDMGLVPGTAVTVVSTNGGNVIVSVKGCRIAVSREMADRIFV